MTSFWRITIPFSCFIVICGAVITWHVYKVKINKQRERESINAYRGRAERGDASAEKDFGDIYYYGRGVPKKYDEALRWYRKAADQGNVRAQYMIGYMYDVGQGLPQDYTEALLWYRQAAEQNDARAQCGLGSMYYDGRGVPQNSAEAVRWYRRAADRGLSKAQYDLGYLYFYGQGVSEDREEANRWYHKAADQGYEPAQRALGLRSKGLSILGFITLVAMFFGCLVVLKDSLFPRKSLHARQQRALTLAGLLGLAYIGMSIYRVFGVFHSVIAVNAFYFAENLLFGIMFAMLISVFSLKGVKFVLGLSGMLFIGMNLFIIAHHALRNSFTTVRGFSIVNGMLIGMSVSLVIFLWLGGPVVGSTSKAGGPGLR
jgi:hypothetical protein